MLLCSKCSTHLQHLPTLHPKSFSITLVQDSQRTAREACEAPDSAMSMHEMPMDIVNPIQILLLLFMVMESMYYRSMSIPMCSLWQMHLALGARALW